MDWFEGEDTPSDLSVKQIDDMAKSYFAQMAVCEEKKKAAKAEDEKLAKMEKKLLAFLENSGRSDYKSPFGTVFKVEKFSVRVPKTPEDKAALFDYLMQEGLYWDKVNIASNVLNSLYSEEIELAKQEQRPVRKFPGIGDPTYVSYLSHRKAK